MLCSNCGKSIPVAGNVCPYCHADKRAAREVYLAGLFVGGVTSVISLLVLLTLGALAGWSWLLAWSAPIAFGLGAVAAGVTWIMVKAEEDSPRRPGPRRKQTSLEATIDEDQAAQWVKEEERPPLR